MRVRRWMDFEISGLCGMMRRREMPRCWKRLLRKVVVLAGGVRVRKKTEGSFQNRRTVEGRERLGRARGRGSPLMAARDRSRQG